MHVSTYFFDVFVDRFLSLGNLLRRSELDEGGLAFWTDIAVDVDTFVHMTHSTAKLKRMWKKVASNFARAEASSKVSCQGSNGFWDLCGGRSDVFYLDRWCDHRQSGREFCAANIYPDDEDDSTQQSKVRLDKTNNRKRQKNTKGATFERLVENLETIIDNDGSTMQAETWREQKLLLQEQRVAQKLSLLSIMLVRNGNVLQELLNHRRECHEQGVDATETGVH
eukprot:jgi/Phyca11/96034/e_gw1.1.1702.1